MSTPAPPLRVLTRREWDVLPERAEANLRYNLLAPVMPDLGLDRHAATRWAAAGRDRLTPAPSPGEADLVALPAPYDLVDPAAVAEAAALADGAGLPLVLLGHSDHYATPPGLARRTVVFHPDLRRSRLEPFQRVHPTPLVFEMDPENVLDPAAWRPFPHEARPRVFWRGAGHTGREPRHRRLAFELTRNWRVTRRRAVVALARADDLNLDTTWAGGWWGLSPEQRQASRRRFLEDVLASPYALVVRGSGNYSFRLYEVMALGRIPVIVDTDTCLPWPDLIPWREISVWIPRSELRAIGARVHAFHARFDPAGFAALQERIRDLWRRHLSEVGFYATVCDRLAAGTLA